MTRPLVFAATLGALSLSLFAAPAAAQTRVLVLADGSTRFSAVSYFNAAVSEFATVVGAANVQGRNDLDTVNLTAADLRRASGESYDVVVLVTSFNGIGTSNWTLLRDSIRTRAARSFVLFSDHCSICSSDNVDGGNGNGLVPLFNAAAGLTATIGILRTDQLPVPLNTRSPLSTSFTGMNPMQTYDYHSMNGIPVDNALYLAPGASLPPAGTVTVNDVTAFFLPTSQSYRGNGACVFGIADVNPLAIPGNPGRVGPAFVNAVTSPTGSCALGPLVITSPTAGATLSDPRPPIRGVSQPGTTVTVTVGGQTLTTITAADGTWSVTPTDLAEGTYTATATRTIGGVTQTATVTFTIILCGGGFVAGAERCDDGNTMPGDGCSATCEVEAGYVCRGDRSVCRITCGDGVRASSEACDDGNTTAGDGCSTTCTLEEGFGCENPDVSVYYSRRGVADCVVVPDFEPVTPTATVPAGLAVPGVSVWSSYRARYVSGAVDFSDRPTAFRAPTLLQFDPGSGARAAMFGGFARVGQTSPAGARTVAEMSSFDFGVGVAGSVRAAVPDIPMACSNNSDTAITYRIDSMSACAPVCRDTSPSDTDQGCTAMAPHCRPVGVGGGRCEPCIDTSMTGADVGCTTATPHCIASGGSFRCVACRASTDCDDGDPCTIDACGADGACMRAPVPTGDRGGCAADRVCSAAPSAMCVICVSDAQCSGATPRCDTATNTCHAAPDAAMEAGVDATVDVTADVEEAGIDAAPDVMDAMVAPDVIAPPDVMMAPDVMMPTDVSTTDVVTPRDVALDTMDGGLTIAYHGGGCGCSTEERSSNGGAFASAFVAIAITARRRRRR